MSELQVSTEEIEYCKVRVNYTADSKVVSEKNKEAIYNLKKLPVPGFRPGKATDVAIKVHFKDKIKQWVEREMLNQANDDVIYETKMTPLGQPQVEKHSLKGNEFSCQLVYLKKPDFELKQYKGIEVPEPHSPKTVDEMAEQIVQGVRTQHSDITPYGDGDFIQAGDRITLDYTVGEETKEGQLYQVGQKIYPEFDENLFGMSPGETREFELDINGKKTSCKVNFHMGMKQVAAPLDDELAKKVGLNSLEELFNTAKTIAQNQFKSNRDSLIAEQIKATLVSSHDFEPPTWSVLMEAQHMSMMEGFKLWETIEEDIKTAYLARGKDNVKFTLILDSINKAEPETVISELEAVSMLKQTLAQRGIQNVDAWIQRASQDGTLIGLIAKAKVDYTLQWLVDNTKIVGV